MTKENLLMIAERNLKKANLAYEHNYNRIGVTEQEKENLKNNREYNKIVRDLIKQMIERTDVNFISEYQRAKERIKNKAIEWQLDFCNHNYSNRVLSYYKDYFEKQAKRYGLVREFRENGII